MRIEFEEVFSLAVQEPFGYFKTPADWPRLYGMFGAVTDLGNGWYSVPLKKCPFPLVAKITTLEADQLVHWKFRGFWRGEGEVWFSQSNGKVTIKGYEDISIRWLFMFSPIMEKLLIERRFREVWRYGWRRLHKLEGVAKSGVQDLESKSLMKRSLNAITTHPRLFTTCPARYCLHREFLPTENFLTSRYGGME